MSWSFTEPPRPGVYWLRDLNGSYTARKTKELGWIPVDGSGWIYGGPAVMYGPRIPEPKPPTPKQLGEMMEKYMKATGWKPETLKKKGKRNA